MEQKPVKSELQRFIIKKLDDLGMTQRRFADEFPDYSIATYGTWRRQDNVMGLEVLESILFKYPQLKTDLADYLRGNTEEKGTAATNPAEAAVRENLADLRRQVADLSARNSELTRAILNFSESKVIKEG